jgi:DNA adenine methylase
MNNKSPLRYPGGKTKACKIIEQTLLKYTNVDQFKTVISPFFGGGSFEFYLQNKYNLNIIANDKFTPLYSFFNQVKHNKNKMVTSLKQYKNQGISKDLFFTLRKEIMTLDEDSLKQAIHFFIINRCSFSGSTLSGGFSEESAKTRFTENSINNIEMLDMSKTEIHNLDFIDFLKKSENCGTNILYFLDPPYYLEKKSNLYGKDGDMHKDFDHLKLKELLTSLQNWILCYNDCEEIRKMYKNYKIEEVNWNYGMNKSKKSSEILICNF